MLEQPITKLDLNPLQYLFIQWRAEVLGIPLQESIDRFIQSWNIFPHNSDEFRLFITQSHYLLWPFYGDGEKEVYDAHRMHQHIHMLRWMSYDHVILPEKLMQDKEQITILDYGCGLAGLSLAFIDECRSKNIQVKLILVDIETIMLDFLRWAVNKLQIPTLVLAMPETSEPFSVLPKCDIAIVSELWEHLHDPLPTLAAINISINPGGYLVTLFGDHHPELFHVSPELAHLREAFDKLGYMEDSPACYRKPNV